MINVGGYLEYRGGVQYREGYSVRGDIMSTVVGVQYCGGINLLLFEYPHCTEHPTVLMISIPPPPPPTVLKLQRMVINIFLDK